MAIVHLVVSLVLVNTVNGSIIFLMLRNNQLHVVLCTLHYSGGKLDISDTASLTDDAEYCLYQPIYTVKIPVKIFLHYSHMMCMLAVSTVIILQVCSNVYLIYIIYYFERRLTAIYTELRRKNNEEYRMEYINDLQIDGPGEQFTDTALPSSGMEVTPIPADNLEHANCDLLTTEEEILCKEIKLSESDKFISIIGKKVDRSQVQLFRYLGIEKHHVYQETVVWEFNEKNVPEKVVNVLNHWLHMSREGHTLFELYAALKCLKYYYILQYLIPVIRDNIHSSWHE